jgi:glycine/D-amino acid oxidase-like deaminating enzyme/nitrite reductase/ring-hydroxylating ferredoxin subunit
VDVAVVGAGITGLTAALLLKRAGKRVAVIEAGQIGTGVTGATTAHLTTMLDMRYQDLIGKWGADGARDAAASSRAAIKQIAQIAAEQIDCDFEWVDGYLYTEDARQLAMLHAEAKATERIDLETTLTGQAPLPYPVRGALRFERQAQFHPLKYLQGLARAVEGDGSRIYEQTRVLDVADREPCRVQTETGTVTADSVILATHVPINDLLFTALVAPYRSYVLGLRLNESVPNGLFWDTAEPYHYIRGYGDTLIVGGADHKTGQEQDTEAHYRQLEAFARARFQVAEITYHWSSQVYEPVDGLPYIGKHPLKHHVYVATGFSGTGMTFGTLAAMLLRDELLGQENQWAELYSTTRIKPLAGGKRFIAEGVNVAAQAVGGWLSPAETEDFADIEPGQGRIAEVDGKKLAVYRDEHSAVHALSPICTHAGCIVAWNSAERTWDCPCHGGRYSPTGEVIEGPPSRGLQPNAKGKMQNLS